MEEKFKILIVEDRDEDRRLLKKMLKNTGCEVEEAINGLEGLEMARLHKPGLIISDALMPKMDGYQFLRKIKKDKELKTIPFIFYSAVYTSQMDEKLALSLGARAYIEKPVEPDLLIKKIESLIQEFKTGKGPEPVELIDEEEEYLTKYSAVVATKLEEKVEELEKVNASLQQQNYKRKQAEEELEKQYGILEERVKARTLELDEANSNLHDYIKKLEEYNKLFVDREFRIKELREQVKELEQQLRDK